MDILTVLAISHGWQMPSVWWEVRSERRRILVHTYSSPLSDGGVPLPTAARRGRGNVGLHVVPVRALPRLCTFGTTVYHV